jgi:hypothetical protein
MVLNAIQAELDDDEDLIEAIEIWIEECWEIDDNYSAASFNFECFDEAYCNNYDLQQTALCVISAYYMSDKHIDSVLGEGE